jgi:hypothetical protein
MECDFELEWFAVLASQDPDGGATANVGDSADDFGTAASAPLCSPLGFYGGASPPSTGSSGPQNARVLQLTMGPWATLIAATDDREVAWIDTFSEAQRVASDRFVTAYGKNSRLELRTSSADSIGLYGNYGRKVLVDDQNGNVTVQWNDEPPSQVNAEATFSDTGVSLSYTDASGNTCTVQLSASGAIALTGMTLAFGGAPSFGGVPVNITGDSSHLSMNQGGASWTLSAAGVVLSFGAVSLTLTATGAALVGPPGTIAFSVNGTPIVVP